MDILFFKGMLTVQFKNILISEYFNFKDVYKRQLFSMENEREAILITMAMTGDITDSVA